MESATISIFRTLRDDEIEIVLNSPAMVAMLIAGADDDVDKDEIREAISFATNSASKYPLLGELFEELSRKFEEIFNGYIADLPKGLDVRQHAITSYLRQLNGILPKIELECAIEIRKFLVELAQTVAEASGGFLGMNKVSKAEAQYLSLDMIHMPE